ncbi:ABC transporter ATP-binding protein, partial [Aeromonas salmonicida]
FSAAWGSSAASDGYRDQSRPRARLLHPPVLVLDEATAAADADNEVKLQQALSAFAHGRTLVVIEKRMDTVMKADQIRVIDNGK